MKIKIQKTLLLFLPCQLTPNGWMYGCMHVCMDVCMYGCMVRQHIHGLTTSAGPMMVSIIHNSNICEKNICAKYLDDIFRNQCVLLYNEILP